MDMQGLSESQSSILDQVSVSMLSKSLKGEESQAAEVLKSLSPTPLPEGSGARVDLFA